MEQEIQDQTFVFICSTLLNSHFKSIIQGIARIQPSLLSAKTTLDLNASEMDGYKVKADG